MERIKETCNEKHCSEEARENGSRVMMSDPRSQGHHETKQLQFPSSLEFCPGVISAASVTPDTRWNRFPLTCKGHLGIAVRPFLLNAVLVRLGAPSGPFHIPEVLPPPLPPRIFL